MGISEEEKFDAAKRALRYIKNGNTIGLGTGSTASIFITLLGAKNRKNPLNLRCIATSKKSEELAISEGLALFGFEDITDIDIAVDGADAVCGKNLIKGLGGALAREKAVEYRARRFIVIADSSKVKTSLNGIVPVESTSFAAPAVARDLVALGAGDVKIRKVEHENFITDNGNLILDANFPRIDSPRALEKAINKISGVLDNGIFTRRCKVIIGKSESGSALGKR